MSKKLENVEPNEETTPSVEAEQEATESPQPDDQPNVESQAEEVADDAANPNAEAAKYRKRLRDAEAQRDELAAKVEQYQRREVEKYAERLQKPSAIWAAGIELKDLLDDEGNVDPDKAQLAVQTAADELGLSMRSRQPRPHPAQQGTSGIPGDSETDKMAQVISGRRN